jgi:hypothetical protein
MTTTEWIKICTVTITFAFAALFWVFLRRTARGETWPTWQIAAMIFIGLWTGLSWLFWGAGFLG